MFNQLSFILVTMAAFVWLGAGLSAQDQKKKTATVIGEVKSLKNTPYGINTLIEVLAQGEEKARSYHVLYAKIKEGPIKEGPILSVLTAVRAAKVGDRVELEWVPTEHGRAIQSFQVLKKGAKPFWQKMVELSKTERVSGRKNGVLLRTSVEVVKDVFGPTLFIHWSLDYDGPRRPLIILKPSLESYAWHQCWVSFLAVDKVDDLPIVGIQAALPPPVISPGPRRISFLIIQKDEVAKGTIDISLWDVEDQFKKKYPGRFQKFPPIRLFAQIDFRPGERGAHLNLDAWTGHLRTEWIPVPLEKLIKK